jgi:Beta-propeller repeat
MRKFRLALLSLALVSTCLSAQTQTGPTSPLHKRIALSEYGKLPLSFEANRGQADGQVKFLSRGNGFSLFLTNDEAVIALKKAGPRNPGARKRPGGPMRTADNDASADARIRLQLLGANMSPRVVGIAELPGKTNYFIGGDPAKWRTNVPTYAEVKYEGIYPGVDLIYYGNRGRLEYDFVLAPGIDPGLIGLRFRGGSEVKIDEKGDLLLHSDGVRFQKPLVYQNADGTRKQVESRYLMTADNTIRFSVGAYDRSKPLVIDPVILYSTYLGGSGTDNGGSIAVDETGNAYLTGQAGSVDFPIVNAVQPTFAGTGFEPSNVFITKINANGSALVYSTYLGGSGRDFGSGIAVDPSGNVYVTGFANSFDFPTVNALQPVSHGCCGPDGGTGFVAKLNPAGSALVYSTFLGGFGDDSGDAIAADAAGNAYVTGATQSTDFPTAHPLQATLGTDAGSDAFVTKINPNGSALVFSTYLGGGGDFAHDSGTGIAIDPAGNVYVVGTAQSSNFPTANALQPNRTGGENAFVTKINPSGSAFVYSTYLGGSSPSGDSGDGIAVDRSGNAYVVGETFSADFPTVNPVQSTLKGSSDAFLTKINASGSALDYSTFLGGSGTDVAGSVAVDDLGNAYIAGATESTDFPTLNALQATFGGLSLDGFVAEINPSGAALIYSTYLGGSGDDLAFGIALDPLGNVYVSGSTNSANFPTVNALQPALGGAGANNAFVTKIASTIAARLNLSGIEFFPGLPCGTSNEHLKCGVHFVGWGGGNGHAPNGWVPFPGDEKALWQANVNFQGEVAFGSTVNLLKGRLELLLRREEILSEIVTNGTVVWPPSATSDLGCGEGVAKVIAFFKTKHGRPASFVGCLHDLPAGSVIPPKIWGTFFTLKGEIDEDHQSPE